MPRTGGIYSPPAGTKGVPNTTILSAPYNAFIDDLTADANAARPITAGGTGATSASAARTALGLAIGTDVQAYDAGLASIAGLTTSANQMIYTTALDVYATTALTPFARTILDDANASTVLTTLGVSAFAQTILDDTSAGAMLTTLGVSAFMQTTLDDADAATFRATTGTNNSSNQTTGTLDDARLPGTMSPKVFTGSITLAPASGTPAIYLNSAGVDRARVVADTASDYVALQKFSAAGAFQAQLQILGAGTTDLKFRSSTVWTAENDGASSGLDADLLDGQQGSYYLDAANLTGTLNDARLPGTMSGKTFTGPILNTTGSAGAPAYSFSGDTNNGIFSPSLDVVAVSTAGTERFRVTSTATHVGKTAFDVTVTGCSLSNNGIIQSTRSGDIAGQFNRLASDGTLIEFMRSSTGVGSVSVTTTATAYNTSSDYRLKTDVVDYTLSGGIIDALRPVEYTWRATDERGVGFIAHEVQEVFPEAVTGQKDAVNEDGEPVYQGGDWSKLVPILVAEIKSLRSRMAELENKA